MTGPAPDPTPMRRSGGFLRLALVVSLAVNLLFLGLIVAGAVTGGQRQSAAAGPDLRALWRALPDDSRAALRAQMHDDTAGGPRPDRAERRALAGQREAELLALLRAEEFDAAAFTAMLEDRRVAVAERTETAQSLLVARLAALDVAERAAIAERYESRRARRFGAR